MVALFLVLVVVACFVVVVGGGGGGGVSQRSNADAFSGRFPLSPP